MYPCINPLQVRAGLVLYASPWEMVLYSNYKHDRAECRHLPDHACQIQEHIGVARETARRSSCFHTHPEQGRTCGENRTARTALERWTSNRPVMIVIVYMTQPGPRSLPIGPRSLPSEKHTHSGNVCKQRLLSNCINVRTYGGNLHRNP